MHGNFGPELRLWLLVTAILAAIVGWRALRSTPLGRRRLIAAYVILLIPFAGAAIGYPRGGFLLAVEIAFTTWLSPLVGLALTVAAIYRHRTAR